MLEILEKEYSVGEVAEVLKEQIHNLRHWQKELGLPDRRNELNQRIYTQSDINTFRFIKELRENEKLSLKAIRKVINRISLISEEPAATCEVVSVNSRYAAIDKLKTDLLCEIDRTMARRNHELKDELEGLRVKIEYLEQERNAKLDQLIGEWRERNRKKGLIERLFNK